jgi:PKD repeat protein
MSKILTALATLVAALAIAPLASAQVCADCDPGGGGGGTSNAAPTAAFSSSPVSPKTFDDVTFTNSSTDSDGSIASSSWSFGDGGTNTTASPTHAYANGGTYTVTLTVTDNDGASSSVSHDVTVANQAPTADFSMPAVGFPGQPVSFTGSANDPEGHLASYSWSFGDNGMADVLSPQHTYAQPGTYEVSFRAYDNQNAASTLIKKSIRINAAPTAHVNPVADGVAGTAVQFTSTNADSDGTIASSCWDFGDGKQACGGGNPAHTYTAPGDYTAKLTVTDNDGSTGTDSITVHVAPAPSTGGGSTNDGGGSTTTSDSTTTGGSTTGGGSTTSGGGSTTTGGGSTTTGGGSTQVGGSAQGAKDTTAPVITVPASLKAKKSAGKVAVALRSNEAVTVVANLTGKVKGSAKAAINGKGTLVIKLSSKAKKALQAARAVKLTLAITATDAAGNTTTKKVKVSLV